jgi:hypothetical protein
MKYYTTTTEFNCGIDLHARQARRYFLQKVEPYRHDLTVVSECTFNWYWLADACETAGIKFVLAHALYAAPA